MQYNLDDLSRPETYLDDDELAAIARRLATQKFHELGAGRCGRGDLKEEFLAGKHADIVHAEVKSRAKKASDKRNALSTLPTVSLPAGYSIEITLDEIILRGQFDDNLHARIKRIGGYWDGRTERNRKLWSIPREKAASLKRVLFNWSNGADERNTDRALQQEKSDRADAVRFLGYVETKAQIGIWYWNGEQKLDALTISRWPELQERLDAARIAYSVAIENKARASAERWIGYVEEHAENGRLYANGVSRLLRLEVSRWPDLASRLDAARAKVTKAKADKKDGAKTHQSPIPPRKGKPRRLFLVSNLPAEKTPIRLGRSVVVIEGFGRTFILRDDEADIHDLMGHEGEGVCYGYYRTASGDEVAQLEKREAEQSTLNRALKNRQEAIKVLENKIRTTGERPDGWNTPEGDRLIDCQNIYGGGSWFVVGPEWIWFCLNNGHDGDDWKMNNVRTGGAGAIGWRVPFDAELSAKIRSLNSDCQEGDRDQ